MIIMDMAKIVPVRGKVMGKLIKEAAVSEGGIHIPDQARRTKHQVTVTAIGEPDPEKPWPADMKVGSVLVTAPYGGKEIEINGEQYLFLTLDELVAVVK